MNLTILTSYQTLQFRRSTCQDTKCLEVHRNCNLTVRQQLSINFLSHSYMIQSICCFLRTHRVEITNAKQTDIRSIDIIDNLHVSKDTCIATVINVMI